MTPNPDNTLNPDTKHNLATARTPRRRSDTVGHGSDTNSDSRRIAERHPRTRLGHASRNVDVCRRVVHVDEYGKAGHHRAPTGFVLFNNDKPNKFHCEYLFIMDADYVHAMVSLAYCASTLVGIDAPP